MQPRVHGGNGGGTRGGILTYPVERLFEEAAYVAYHFHWSLDEILDLEHADRRQFVAEIASINQRLSQEE